MVPFGPITSVIQMPISVQNIEQLDRFGKVLSSSYVVSLPKQVGCKSVQVSNEI